MKISINGQVVEMMDMVGGNTMVVKDDQVIINGKTIDNISINSDRKLTVEVVKGTLHTIKADGSVNCKDVSGSISAGGSINCDSIKGNASAGGSINCDDIGGNASAGGSIRCDTISGSVNAGGKIVTQ